MNAVDDLVIENFTWETIETIFPVGERADEDRVTDFLRHPQVVSLVRRVTRASCNRFGVNWGTHGEDFEAECRLMLWRWLVDPAARASAMRIRNGLHVALLNRFADKTKTILESSAWVGSRGMSSQLRRHRYLMVHAERLRAELGRDPSQEEVIESYNARVMASRKDAARQGVVATVADFNDVAPVGLDSTLNMPAASHHDDLPLASVEARPLLRAVLVAAGAVDPVLRLVVQEWLGHFDDDPPFIATVSEIADALTLDEDTVRNLLVQAGALCRKVAEDEFGVTASQFI